MPAPRNLWAAPIGPTPTWTVPPKLRVKNPVNYTISSQIPANWFIQTYHSKVMTLECLYRLHFSVVALAFCGVFSFCVYFEVHTSHWLWDWLYHFPWYCDQTQLLDLLVARIHSWSVCIIARAKVKSCKLWSAVYLKSNVHKQVSILSVVSDPFMQGSWFITSLFFHCQDKYLTHPYLLQMKRENLDQTVKSDMYVWIMLCDYSALWLQWYQLIVKWNMHHIIISKWFPCFPCLSLRNIM